MDAARAQARLSDGKASAISSQSVSVVTRLAAWRSQSRPSRAPMAKYMRPQSITGTPEVAGLTVIQGIEIIRGCRGLDLVGCDLVEVAPIYDPTGATSLTAANLLFEMLCVLPGVDYRT